MCEVSNSAGVRTSPTRGAVADSSKVRSSSEVMTSAVGAFILSSVVRWQCATNTRGDSKSQSFLQGEFLLRRRRDLPLLRVVVVVVDEHDATIMPVQQSGGDRCAVAACAVDPQLLVGGD